MLSKDEDTTTKPQPSTTPTNQSYSNNNNQFSMTTHHAATSITQGINQRPYSLSASNILLPSTCPVNSSTNNTPIGPMSQFPNFNSYSSFQTVNPIKNSNQSINCQSLVPYVPSNSYSSFYNNFPQQPAMFAPNSFRFGNPSFQAQANPSSTSFFTERQQQPTKTPLMPNLLSYQQAARFPVFPFSNSSSSLSSQKINSNQTSLFAPSEQDLLDSEFLNLLDDIRGSKSIVANGASPNSSMNYTTNPANDMNHETNTNIQHSNIKKVEQAKNKTKKKKKEINLIDLSSKIDDIKTLSVIDLFDPLFEKDKQQANKFEENEEEDSEEFDDDEIEQEVDNKQVESQVQPKQTEVSKENEKKEERKEITSEKTAITTKKKIVGLNFNLIDINKSNLKQFTQTINDLKDYFNLEYKELSHLIVFSPILESALSYNHLIRINVRYYTNNQPADQPSISQDDATSSSNQSSTRRTQITLAASLNAAVETIVYDVLISFNIKDLDTNKYLLKIHGLEEYLPVKASLIELKYVHECMIENRIPIFVLVELENVNTQLTGNQRLTSSSDVDQNQFDRTTNIFKLNAMNENVHLISKTKLEDFIRTLFKTRNLIEDQLNIIQKSSMLSNNHSSQIDSMANCCLSLKEKLKFFCGLMNNIHYDSTDKIIARLEILDKSLKQHQASNFLKEKQPLLASQSFNPNSDSNAITDSNLQMLFTSLIETADQAVESILAFLNCTATSFYWPFKPQAVYDDKTVQEESNPSAEQKLEIIQTDEKLVVFVHSFSRLSPFFTSLAPLLNGNIEIFLKFSICYGVKQLDSVYIKLDKLERFLHKKVDHFPAVFRVQFENVDMCILPREAYLLIQMCTINANSTNLNTMNRKVLRGDGVTSLTSTYNPRGYLVNDDLVDKSLLWASKFLFDESLALQTGESFLCMYPTETSKITFSGSNMFSLDSPVIQFSIKKNSNQLISFPGILSECECTLKDFETLSTDTKERLLSICNKNVVINRLSEDEREFIHKNYLYLSGIPYALGKVYLSCPSWDYSSIIHFYAFLRQTEYVTLPEALELLLPCFPDRELREHAVRSLETFSPELIYLYLPQLLEALKFEFTNNSALFCMFLKFANKSIRFAHKLFWLLREYKSRTNEPGLIKYELLFKSLVFFLTKPMLEEIEQEEYLVQRIDQIASRVKETKEAELSYELDALNSEWPLNNKGNQKSCRLPLNISYCTKEIDIKSCSVISSFTMPLKLVFKNIDPTANSYYTIYKIGDDLRQDMFVLQLINIMNQLWIMEDLDLNVLTFNCLQTGNRRGFIEMITNADTLKEIQKGAVMNAFRKNCINDWLRSHNPNLSNFKKAVINFTKSCAAYSVATYILGIGDRHNDNIMIKYTGHMFHIDFGKYLGDAQTFAGFKRDRNPILFTLDMFYVINQGNEPNARFQEFVEMCCKAFQTLRKNYHLILNLIEMMTSSGIPGLNRNAIRFVYKNLMIDMNEDDSSNALKKLIHESLSKFASLNFAIHTLAQPKTVSSSNYFSFVTHLHNAETDGKILSISVDPKLHNTNSKTPEMFKCFVTRENEYDTNEVYRTFDEFCELYQLLQKTFPGLRLQHTPSLNKFKETKNTSKRLHAISSLINDISKFQSEISQSDIIYTFFHSILRDQKQLDHSDIGNEYFVPGSENNLNSENMLSGDSFEEVGPEVKGQIKIKLKFKDNKFFVYCLQCRNLKPPNDQPISSLKPYVKCYLRPDSNKATKKKVQALFNGANPIFTETMEYDISLNELKHRILEVSVLNYKINVKERIGSVEIRLFDLNWDNEFTKWYDLR